ncbi:unnamed protein product [Dimorphilus gyrociliatus]|uniref:Uncharacterized protein n=1 Tax=Dimorphilus gyrociliatus TaxID=2664684 RepID=A0A7I8VFH0_9ANNE|nr:unnamed protein product [Dimorphilus gyrociliatus]
MMTLSKIKLLGYKFENVESFEFLNSHPVQIVYIHGAIDLDCLIRNVNPLYIEELKFASCFINSKVMFDFFKQVKNLSKFSLRQFNSHEEIGNSFLKSISQSGCSLTSFELICCKLSSDIGACLGAFIGKQTTLNVLNLCSTNLKGELGRDIFRNIPPAFSSLKELNLNDCSFTSDIGQLLGKFIGYQTNLNKLELSNIILKGEIGKNLFKDISSLCCNIKILKLSKCEFSYDMCEYLGRFIGLQIQLQKLDFGNTNLKDEIGINIFKYIPSNFNNLKEFSLRMCQFSPEMIEPLGRVIRNQDNLQKLDLYLTNPISEVEKIHNHYLSSSECNISY